MVYVFLATGSEDIEALAPVDIIRRAGLEVSTVSISDQLTVRSAHGVGIVADMKLEDVKWEEASLLVLPGGLPGSTNLDACEPLRQAITAHHRQGKALAAICAAPLVLGHLGILRGRKATCYPGVEGEMEGATYTASIVERDGNIVTGRGPAAAMEFGFTLVDLLLGEGQSSPLREGMMYNQLLSQSE